MPRSWIGSNAFPVLATVQNHEKLTRKCPDLAWAAENWQKDTGRLNKQRPINRAHDIAATIYLEQGLEQ